MNRHGWVVLAVACGDAGAPAADPTDDEPAPPAVTQPYTPPPTTTGVPSYDRPGFWTVEVRDSTRAPDYICEAPVRTFVPEGSPYETVVVLTHGSGRDQEAVRGLAAHLASYGVRVVTTNVCHNVAEDDLPERDAEDLVTLADELGAERRLYVGHGTGGMRSVLAAAMDTDAIGVLGLDLVDSAGWGELYAPSLLIPVDALFAEPHRCNSDNNGIAVVQAAQRGTGIRVVDADTCDFESPTGWMCTQFCDQPGATFDDPHVRGVIRDLLTAWVLWKAGVDDEADGYWTPGDPALDGLLDAGAVEHWSTL